MPAAYRFGPFLVDRAGYRVLRGARRSSCTPKLLDLLLHLARPRRRARHQGSAARRALARRQRHRQRAGAGHLRAARRARRRRRRRPATSRRSPGADTGSSRAVDVSLPPSPPHAPSDRAALDDDRVAVLDFANLTGDADAAWLSAGIAETVSADLARPRPLPRHRSLARRRSGAAGRRRCRTSPRRSRRLRRRRQLPAERRSRAASPRASSTSPSGEAVADAKVDGRLDDIFDLQDQVVEQFARRARARAAAGRRAAARATPPASRPTARSSKAGSRSRRSTCASCRPRSPTSSARSPIDPKYAIAYTGLAVGRARVCTRRRGPRTIPARDLLERAERARAAGDRARTNGSPRRTGRWR